MGFPRYSNLSKLLNSNPVNKEAVSLLGIDAPRLVRLVSIVGKKVNKEVCQMWSLWAPRNIREV